MKRSILCSLALVLLLSIASGCGDDAGNNPDSAPIVLFDAAPAIDAPIPDATPPIDAQLFPLGEAVGVDTAEIVGGPAFSAIGSFVDLQGQIDSGAMLLALEWRDLDDPSGQNDANMAVGFYQCNDPDLDTSNNFDEANPDRWVASPDSVDVSGNPNVLFDTASTTDGLLDATSSTGTITLAIPGAPLPIQLSEPHLQGLLVASGDSTYVSYLADQPGGVKAELSGSLLASTLGATPDFSGGLCGPRNSLLDILALGCTVPGVFTLPPNQPDMDRDGDGLEKLCDTCDDANCNAMGGPPADAGIGDGTIDCCRDGDGTIIPGSACVLDPRITDGYIMQLEIHGTRVQLLSEVDPG